MKNHNIRNTAEIWTITPEQAKELYNRRLRNRKIRDKHVDRLADEILSGNWSVNGEPIILDDDGRLMDGQHRLLACIAAKVPFTTYVIRGGLSENAMNNIDTGVARTPGDTLHFHGYIDTNNLGAACRWIYRLQNNAERYTKFTISRTQLLEMVEKYPDIQRSIIYGRKSGKFIVVSLGTALHWLMSRKSPALADQFFEDISTGVNLSENDPVTRLRNALIKDMRRNAKLPPDHIAALTIKAWNAVRENRTMRYLTYYPNAPKNPDKFPEIL